MGSDYKISVTDKNGNKEEFSVNIENGIKPVPKYEEKECGVWWIFYVIYLAVFTILFLIKCFTEHCFFIKCKTESCVFNCNSKENGIFLLLVLGVLALASIICFSVVYIKHSNEHIRIEKLKFLNNVLETKNEFDNIYEHENINEEHRTCLRCRDNKKTEKTKNLGIELCCKIVNAVSEV